MISFYPPRSTEIVVATKHKRCCGVRLSTRAFVENELQPYHKAYKEETFVCILANVSGITTLPMLTKHFSLYLYYCALSF